MSHPQTLTDKLWEAHIVRERAGEPTLLYIDLHLVHEVTSPQAFEGLRLSGRKVRRADLTYATVDHNVPTTDRSLPIADPISKQQIDTLRANCTDFELPFADVHSYDQGIVHVIGPELGLTLPGKTIVCGDSHTSTHGAFGALAFGIGTSEVEHVLATQCLQQQRPKTMEVYVSGNVPHGLAAKDLILGLIARYGTAFATGYVIEYRGPAISALSIEERMTVCNMSIEAGARAGLIAPDDKTFAYLKGRRHAPQGEAYTAAVERWRQLHSDEDATFDARIEFDAASLVPEVPWGTSPGMGTDLTGHVPNPADIADPVARRSAELALTYMGLTAGTAMEDIQIDRVFIGSCTNGRIEDLRAAAAVIGDRSVAAHVKAMVVPGSHIVKDQAESEGLHEIFIKAGFEWREPGCSMCLAMNPDFLEPGERCASTSNRNFEGRQGRDGRTHLVSPAMAAAAAIAGHFVDVRKFA